VRERVLESTPAFLRRNIRGLSASEHFFHLFLAFLHDAGILDQPTPPPTAVHAALRNSCRSSIGCWSRRDRSR
jgi:glutamine amidotransferase